MLATSAVVAASGAVAAYAATESGSGSSGSGIYGRVLLGPPCPIALERPGTCRDRPLHASFTVSRAAGGKRVATVRSGQDGRFRKTLDPGTYRLNPRPAGSAYGTPVKVRVPTGQFVRVTLRYHSNNR